MESWLKKDGGFDLSFVVRKKLEDVIETLDEKKEKEKKRPSQVDSESVEF